MPPHALVTNDDGIDSAFLRCLVDALRTDFRISIAAPASEQSWIGRAMSRRSEIEVVHRPSLFEGVDQAWAINGTPTDCVNIALGHLLPEMPDIVLSGINIGWNTSESLILSSGTIAGALEGALWGLPALAFSQCVPSALFAAVSHSKGRTEGDFAQSLNAAAAHAARMSRAAIECPPPPGCVFNINFPAKTTETSTLKETCPAKVRLGSLFEPIGPGKFRFRYHTGLSESIATNSDRAALEAGFISRGILDFSKIGHCSSGHE